MTDVHSHPAESRSIIARFILKSGIYTCVSTLLVFIKILLHSFKSLGIIMQIMLHSFKSLGNLHSFKSSGIFADFTA